MSTSKKKLRLTDKEIEALGKQLAKKVNLEQLNRREAAAVKNLPAAKAICEKLKTLPDKVLDALYSNRYSRGQFTPKYVAGLITEREPERDEARSRDFESEIVLKAHECSTLSELCKKLGI